jgi:hypothetical protein
MHDPYVKKNDQNLLRFEQEQHFTSNLNEALTGSSYIILCTSHKNYIDKFEEITAGRYTRGLFDACNIYSFKQFENKKMKYAGIGRGTRSPEPEFVQFVHKSFLAMEMGLANELESLIGFYNANYAFDDFNKVKFREVQKLAKTCSTGCKIAESGKVEAIPVFKGFSSRLVQCAFLTSTRK